MAMENHMLQQHYLADELDAQRHSKAERHRVGRRHKLAVRAAAWQARQATPGRPGQVQAAGNTTADDRGRASGIVLAGFRLQARKAGQT
jgi:hypothetical protein